METFVDILKQPEIGLENTDLSQNVEVVQQKKNLTLGPYLPISSGNFNIVALETSDFDTFFVTAAF